MRTVLFFTSLILCILFYIPTNALALEVGDSAPNFSTQSTNGPVELKSYVGKKNVVLTLFYFVDTPV